MMNASDPRTDARATLIGLSKRKRTLSAPADWGPYRPLLQSPVLEAIESGTWATAHFHEVGTLIKQAGLRLGREALETVFRGGLVDVANRYTPLGEKTESISGLIQLVQHAAHMGEVARISAPHGESGGRYETAADLLRRWVKRGLTVQEMFQGMALEVAMTDCFPYTHLHAWERVHSALHTMPGIYLSAPGRMSLTRLVYSWLKTSRPYGREHEMELMSQIQAYAEVEDAVGHKDLDIAALYEVKDLYHRRETLNAKRLSSVPEPDIVELEPTLAVLGGAMPRTYLLGVYDREVLHYELSRQISQYEQANHLTDIEVEFLDADEIEH